ncbi:16S rRNA (guanine(966)-N(2))-methyltransferase [Candidatus Hepatincolaceae symbiont of Richtersius coronifer]
MVRIIGGDYRGKKLLYLQDPSIRPTMDRVKESMFNLINYHFPQNIRQKNILDAFAGCGSLGIESLSRGANKCVFVDTNPRALANIRDNLNQVNLLGKSVLIKGKSEILNFQNLTLKFSLILLDPPYETNLLEVTINNLLKQDIFAAECIIVTESSLEGSQKELTLYLTKTLSYKILKIYKLPVN